MRARAGGAGQALVQREALADLLLDGVQRVEARHRLLEDEADVVAADAAQGAAVGGQHLVAAVADRAGDLGVLGQEADGGERGDRLAGAALADDGQGLAGVEIEADAADRLGGVAALDEGDAEVADGEERLGEGELAGVLHRRGAPVPGASSGRLRSAAHARPLRPSAEVGFAVEQRSPPVTGPRDCRRFEADEPGAARGGCEPPAQVQSRRGQRRLRIGTALPRPALPGGSGGRAVTGRSFAGRRRRGRPRR